MTTASPASENSLAPLEDRPLRILALVIAALAVAARVWMARATHATAEDFLITLRYAEHIAAGHGFVYNPGERVLGTTTPLYTLLLAAAAWLHLNAALAGKALNILADGATCYLLARLFARREIGEPIAGLFAALLYALSSTPINISISGMETGLVTCAGMLLVYAYVARRAWLLWLSGALLFLLRIDGLLLLALLGAGLAWRERRLPWREMGAALLVALPWLLFAWAYFGSPIPTSLIAKVTVYSVGVTRSFYNLEAFTTQFFTGWVQRITTLLFVVGSVRTLFDLRRSPSQRSSTLRQKNNSPSPSAWERGLGGEGSSVGVSLALPLGWLLIYYGTMLVSHVPAFPWYFLPPWPLLLGIAALGGSVLLHEVGRAVPTDMRSRLAAWWPLALAIFGLFAGSHLPSVRADIAKTQQTEDRLRIPMGLWLRAHARPDDRILLEPIGYVGYYSQRPILDMIGLVSPEVLPSYHTQSILRDIVEKFRPEWLCLRPGELGQIVSQSREQIMRQMRDGQTLRQIRVGANVYDYVRAFQLPDRPPDFFLYHRQESAPPISQ